MNNMSAENQIYMRKTFFDFFCNMLLLHHTTAKRYNSIGFSAFYMHQCADVTENSVLCVFSYRTGIENYQVCFVCFTDNAVTHSFKHTHNFLRIRHVLLTTESANARFRRTVFFQSNFFYFLCKITLNA